MNITAVIVSYNRADLLRRAYESIRKFSNLQLIIIDGSQNTNECYDYCKQLKDTDRNTKVIFAATNIGHGKGMDRGIKEADNDLVLVMDSDAEIVNFICIQEMATLINDRVFGVGQVVNVNPDGVNVGSDYPDPIPYLHPHFALINRNNYLRVPGFVHHGAPCIRTMEYINTFKKLMLIDFPVGEYVNHEGRGTRILNPEGFLKNWQ